MLEELNREVMELKKGVIRLAPLPPTAKPIVSRTAEMTDPLLADAYFRTVRGVIQSIEDTPMNLQRNLIEPARAAPAKLKKTRTASQKRNDKLQSRAFKIANDTLRKNNGEMRKNVDQRMIAQRAQKELRKLKKSVGTKKGQIRKTARRAFKR